MKSTDLNTIWGDIEVQQNIYEGYLQRMVYVDLLYRAYIGTSGIPAKRFLSIEIPENDIKLFGTFTAPQGFTFEIGLPGVKHDGYAACVLQAASSDQNDVFAIVAKDILEELRNQKVAEKYISTLKNRIEKWRLFFKDPTSKRLSEKTIIGLFGELSFIKDMIGRGVDKISDFWNGPIKSSQDFQGDRVAIEVKTASTNKLDHVHISSEMQLETVDREILFLIAYRVELNDATGLTLPELIEQVAELLNEQQRSRFVAKLTCLGYATADSEAYDKRYAIKENHSFRIREGFPRVTRSDLPQGITDINYVLSLNSCDEYTVDFEEITQSVKEYEYGQG